MWLTTLMPSSGYYVWSLELKFNQKILDEVDKQFLSNNVVFVKFGLFPLCRLFRFLSIVRG